MDGLEKEAIKSVLKTVEMLHGFSIHDKRLQYPSQGDDPKSCPMLAFMLRAEQSSGYLIYIPCKERIENV